MNKTKLILIFLFAGSGLLLKAQARLEVIRDLRPEWLIVDGQEYHKFNDDAVKKVFLVLDGVQFKGDLLWIEDDAPFAVFIDQKLVAEKNKGVATFRIDSLARLYSAKLSISVFQTDGVTSLVTQVRGAVATNPVSSQDPFPRKGNFFLDFSLIASIIVLVYLVVLLRTNPRLTFDYLNVAKLFSAQERDENLLASRVTSRVNLLFYFFCCLFCSLALLVVFHLSKDVIPVADHFQVRSTGEGFLQWAKLALIVALLLVLKLSIVFLFAMLFNMRDKAPIQYFNFIRALLLAAGLIALISTVNFILNGQFGVLDSIWLKIGAWVMVLSAAMMYLKLLTLTRYHFFHLFSYLCASEIIPLVILMKILLY